MNTAKVKNRDLVNEKTMGNLSFDDLISEVIRVKGEILKNHGDEKTKEQWEERLEVLNNEISKISERVTNLEDKSKKVSDNDINFNIDHKLKEFRKTYSNSNKNKKIEMMKELKSFYVEKYFNNEEELNYLIYNIVYSDLMHSAPKSVNKKMVALGLILSPFLAFLFETSKIIYPVWIMILIAGFVVFSIEKRIPEKAKKNLEKLHNILNKPEGNTEEEDYALKIPQAVVLEAIGVDVNNIKDEDFEIKNVSDIVRGQKFIGRFNCLSK